MSKSCCLNVAVDWELDFVVDDDDYGDYDCCDDFDDNCNIEFRHHYDHCDYLCVRISSAMLWHSEVAG